MEQLVVESAPAPEDIIRFTHVSKRYALGVDALSGINLSIAQGEFVFLAGASGAGKSTLLKLLVGEEQATTGVVRVAGQELSSCSAEEIGALRRTMGVVFQDYKLLDTRTVLDNVAFALEVTGVSRNVREELATIILSALGLRESLHCYPESLSGGEKQRVAIARALVGRPQIVLADEPTGNLDPDMTIAIFQLLLEANKQGATVIVASHDLALIEELNRRTLVLDRGRLIGDFQKTRKN